MFYQVGIMCIIFKTQLEFDAIFKIENCLMHNFDKYKGFDILQPRNEQVNVKLKDSVNLITNLMIN